MKTRLTRIIGFVGVGAILTTLAGCLGTPFHVAGDLVDASFSAVADVAEVPFEVAGEIADGAVPDLEARYTEHHSWTIDGEGITLVDAKTGDGSIVVEGSNRDEIRVHAWTHVRARSHSAAERFADEVKVYVDRDGERLRVYREYSRSHQRVRVSVRYEIEVPSKTNLDLKTSDGRVSVVHVVGAVTVETSDGKVAVKHAEGDFDLHTRDGKIELESLSGHIRAETSDGAIKGTFNKLEEGVFLSSDGPVDITILEHAGTVRIDTRSGSIHLGLPEDFKGYIDARTRGGGIYSGFPVTVGTTSRKRLLGPIGTGGANRVDLNTSDGSIHLKKIP